ENRNRFFNGAEVFEKRRNAQQRGALALLLINDPLGKHQSFFNNFATNLIRKPSNNLNITSPRRRMELAENTSETPIPIVNISDAVASAIFEPGYHLDALQKQINGKHQPASFELAGKRIKINTEVDTRLLNTSNVIGMLEGSDPNLKKEYVVVSAHLDH